ncbi:phosphotransferase enzyme family protein [Oceanobacillus sp. SE10311]|uniref:phosphotransferase enzyme family protein n=1 Tax=Oceanobacillus sp. SE10311 TaxID=3098289 RepID=UPI00300E2C6A
MNILDKLPIDKVITEYEIIPTDIKLLGGFENNVLECIGQDKSIVLKFYTTQKYSIERIKAELNWIRHLQGADVIVTSPIPTINGELIVTACNIFNQKYHVVAYEKAKGTPVNDMNSNEWDDHLFYIWGKTMGKMHVAAKSFQFSNDIFKTLQWNKEDIIVSPPELGKTIHSQWNKFISQMKQFPKDPHSYGFIHHDLHQQNFYLDHNELVLFDFGDGIFHWFANDIAISLYHAIQSIQANEQKKRKEFAMTFLSSFIRGYMRANQLNEKSLLKIPFFINYRQIYSYVYFINYLSVEQKKQVQVTNMLKKMKNNIEKHIPYLNINDNDIKSLL